MTQKKKERDFEAKEKQRDVIEGNLKLPNFATKLGVNHEAETLNKSVSRDIGQQV